MRFRVLYRGAGGAGAWMDAEAKTEQEAVWKVCQKADSQHATYVDSWAWLGENEPEIPPETDR